MVLKDIWFDIFHFTLQFHPHWIVFQLKLQQLYAVAKRSDPTTKTNQMACF